MDIAIQLKKRNLEIIDHRQHVFLLIVLNCIRSKDIAKCYIYKNNRNKILRRILIFLLDNC